MADTAAAHVDRLCDLLEAGWKAGLPPRIEELLADCPEDARRPAFAELLALEQEYRAKTSQPLNRDEVRVRFAAYESWAKDVLEKVFPQPSVLTVTVNGGPHSGDKFELTGYDSYTIGRQLGLSVSLPKDGYVSRVHLLVSVVGNTVRVMDLGSKGGTFVGENRVPQWEFAGSGSVRVGDQTELMFHLAGSDFDATVLFGGSQASLLHVTPIGPPAIPGYQMLGELGRGAMGVVYRAVRELTGETVALKTILPALAPTRTMVARFCREADILAKLAHTNVVGFRESGAAGGVLFVAMEFVQGRSGAEVGKRQGPLAPSRLVRWADHMLLGLSHAHVAGIVHRDVKPANLMVTETPGGEVVKVADFGLARAYESSGASGVTADQTMCGTLAFLPPEQVTNARRVGPAADQYAAAATLYHLLIGQPIFPIEKTTQSQIGRILSDEPIPLRPGATPLPEPFDRVIRRALARDPKERFPSCEAMRVELLRG